MHIEHHVPEICQLCFRNVRIPYYDTTNLQTTLWNKVCVKSVPVISSLCAFVRLRCCVNTTFKLFICEIFAINALPKSWLIKNRRRSKFWPVTHSSSDWWLQGLRQHFAHVCLWCRKQFQFILDGRAIYLVLLLVGIYRDVLHYLQLLSSSTKTCSREFVY